jgi:hypothetical protein
VRASIVNILFSNNARALTVRLFERFFASKGLYCSKYLFFLLSSERAAFSLSVSSYNALDVLFKHISFGA